MAFRVKISARARRDLESILQWLLEQGAGEAGVRWWRGLSASIYSLETDALHCSMAPESETLHAEVRHLLYGRKPHVYRILFTVQSEEVHVIHVRHGRQLPIRKQ